MSTETDSNTTPERYRPEPRKFDQKEWLYEQYWGELLSAAAIADNCDVSTDTIYIALDDHGIPRRPHACHDRSDVGPFDGFYVDEDSDDDGEDQETTAVDWSGMVAGDD